MQDINGSPIEVGSKVAYFQGGRYDSVNIGTVMEIKTKVKVMVTKSSRAEYGPGGETWAHSDRIVVIETQGRASQ